MVDTTERDGKGWVDADELVTIIRKHAKKGK